MQHTQEDFEDALRLLGLYWAYADLDYAWPMLDGAEAHRLGEETFNLLLEFGVIKGEG